MTTFHHGGKLGDIIYSLPAVRTWGNARIFIGSADPSGLGPETVNLILPLLAAQPYIESAFYWTGQHLEVDFDGFGEYAVFKGRNLVDCHQMKVGLDGPTHGVPTDPRTGTEKPGPWLTVDSVDPETAGRVLFARSNNYRGVHGFWEACLKVFGDRALFVGTSQEHAEFCSEIGPIPYHPTENLLELARAIAGAELFVGNQSSPYAIAEGLKRPVIQEVYRVNPNCVFDRNDALYVYDESHFPLISRFAETHDASSFGVDLSFDAIWRAHERSIELPEAAQRQGRPLNFAEQVARIAPVHREDRVHPHDPAERSHRFAAFHARAPELEVLNFLNALVYLFKPVNVLETGTGTGLGTMALGSALLANNSGFLRTVESDAAASEQAMQNLNRVAPALSRAVKFYVGDSREFIADWKGAPFDFVYFDTELNLRHLEFQMLAERGMLTRTAVCVFHDTSRLRGNYSEDYEPDLIAALDAASAGRQWIECGLSRGLE